MDDAIGQVNCISRVLVKPVCYLLNAPFLAAQVAPLLNAASAPATIVNWCGDEAVTPEQWCALFGEHLDIEPQLTYYDLPGSQPGSAADPTRRRSLTGPCTVAWRDGMVAMVDARHGSSG